MHTTARPVDNLRAVGAGHAYSAKQGKSAELVAAAYAAEDEALAQIDSYVNWLSGECYQCNPVHSLGWVPVDADALAARVASFTVPQLIALQNYPRADACFAASLELQRRYLAQIGVA